MIWHAHVIRDTNVYMAPFCGGIERKTAYVVQLYEFL